MPVEACWGSHAKLLLLVLFCSCAMLTASMSHAGNIAFHNSTDSEQRDSRVVPAKGNPDTGLSKSVTAGDNEHVDTKGLRFSPSGRVYHDPDLSISPSGTQWVAAGASVGFTLTVTNTSSTDCDLTSFDLSVSAPRGWDVELDRNALEIAPDWTTDVLDLVVTSPAQEQDGSYDIIITAGNKLLSIGAATNVTYVIDSGGTPSFAAPEENAAPDGNNHGAIKSSGGEAGPVVGADKGMNGSGTCIHNEPGLALVPAVPQKEVDLNPRYEISLTNNDLPACAESTFDLTISFLPEGWEGRLSDRQLIVPPGESGRASLVMTPSSIRLPGSYRLQVGISNAQYTEIVKTVMTSHAVTDEASPLDNGFPSNYRPLSERITHLQQTGYKAAHYTE